MADTDEVMYIPLMFGFSSYAREGFRRHRLRFGNAPTGASGMRGSVLGGVGIALSALSIHREAAADLARTIGSGAVQAGLYVDSGGQPGHGAAWESDSANAQTGDFFRATRDTMEQAFVRPRVAGHRPFQLLAGERVHRFLWGEETDPAACIDDLRRLYDRHLDGWGAIETGGWGNANRLKAG